MASITFVDQQTVIPASWLNDVNTAVYSPTGATYLTATAGQTVFTVPTYVANGGMRVYINGILQQYNVSYTETNTTTITFSEGLTVGLKVAVNSKLV